MSNGVLGSLTAHGAPTRRLAETQLYAERNYLDTPERRFNAGYRDATAGSAPLTEAQFGYALACMRSNALNIAASPPLVVGSNIGLYNANIIGSVSATPGPCEATSFWDKVKGLFK